MTTTQPQPIASGPPGHGHRTAPPVIAFLGTGRMGSPMAANLARGGFDVRVWNRTTSRAAALAADGAVVASSPAEAVRGATIVVTMLADGPATEQAATGPDGLLTADPGTIWVQMATVGADWTARLARLAGPHAVVFVDAPVSGSEGPGPGTVAGRAQPGGGASEDAEHRGQRVLCLVRAAGQDDQLSGPGRSPANWEPRRCATARA